METGCMPKEFWLFYAVLLNFPLYIRCKKFIIDQVTLPTPYKCVRSNFMLVFKIIHLNLFPIVILLTLKVFLGDHPTRLKPKLDYFKINFFKVNPHRNSNIVVPTVCALSKNNISLLIHQRFSCVSIARIKKMRIEWLIEVLPTNLPDLKEPCPIYLLTKVITRQWIKLNKKFAWRHMYRKFKFI